MKKENFELRNVKGTFDFLPQSQAIRNNIMDILKKNFVKYGYMPLETPILNEFDLLKYKYSENAEILSEIYRLTDQGKRDLGLRYDLTVPFCKVIGLNKDLQMPFRRYEIGKVFRDGPVKLGRTREFYQCDVDVVGIDGRYIEVEQMQMVLNIFKELNIDICIKWNNRKLMVGILEYLGYKENQFDEIIGLIDRCEKITIEELKKEFENIGINNQGATQILDMFAKSLDDYAKIAKETEIQNFVEGLNECLEVQQLVEKLEIQNKVVFTAKLARGLGIYTGTVFEFFDNEKRITSSLGGGGRYNRIITEFMDNGTEYPAVGLSFGLEPIYAILSETAQNNFVDVMIIPMDTQIECLKIAEKLREAGFKTIIDFSGKKLKKSFDYANKTNIKFVMVVGENEINTKQFSIKNMQTGEQFSFEIEKIVEYLKEQENK